MLSRLLSLGGRVLPAEKAFAHCDIPCGIYDPHAAQLAAVTVLRMASLMKDAQSAGASDRSYANKMARYTEVLEHHADICKTELRILWGDYFKPEHVQQFPNLHDLFWNALKAASKARQEPTVENGQALLDKVQQVAEIFWKTKGLAPRRNASGQPVGGELVYPGAKA